MTLPYIGETLRLRALTASEAMFACVLAVSVPFVALHPAIEASRARSWLAGLVMAIAAAMTFSHSVSGVAVSAVAASWQRLRGWPALRVAAIAGAATDRRGAELRRHRVDSFVGDSPLRDNTIYHYAVDGGRAQIAGVNVEYQTMSYFRLKQVAWDALQRPAAGGHRPRSLPRDHGSGVSERPAHRAVSRDRSALDVAGRLAETGLIGAATLMVLWMVIAIGKPRLLGQHHRHAGSQRPPPPRSWES